MMETEIVAQRGNGLEVTLEEREAIAGRVSIIGERVLLVRELPVQTPLSVTLMFDRIETLARNWDRFAYVVDLTDAQRPDAETRAALKQRVVSVRPRVAHVALAVGDNLIMRAMARVFAYAMGLPSVSVHATRVEAIEEARRVVGP